MAVNREDFFDKRETMSPGERRQYLDQKLQQTITRAYHLAPAIKSLFDRSGVNPEQIMTTTDLEKLPITRKSDLIAAQKASPPYGSYLAIPPEDVERVFLSPGPIYEPIQHSGIQWFAKAFWAAGFRKGDIVVNTFTYHLSPAGILFHEALKDCSATAIPMGTGNTEIQVKTMLDLKVTGFVGTPTFLITVIRKAEEMGHDFNRDFSLRRAWFTGEMLSPSLRKTFEGDYRIHTTQAYAVTEPGGAIAYECSQQSGMHLMDDYVVEIVDPETGKQLPPGETGEIVVTPIHNQAWGLIRFGTGDISALTTEPCPCGRTASKLTAILGRAGDAIKVRGMFVVAKQAEQAVTGFTEVSRFQLVVGQQEHRDHITLKVELKGPVESKEKLANDLKQGFQRLCRVKLDGVAFIKKGTIAEGQPVITDERVWD